ncbi:TnsA endonuclease N-terminal domain-containing protein [Variovorax sp. J22R203]|nr:TnsA endonuclease N-terminal domain-containing protein [Variovorax sp. J22R203]MDM0007474.1 TnsA endonuclease N-terminal domain-containing protein [Variovorax sp. J22R203]
MQPPQPSRRIPVSEISMTGCVNGQEFESALERDFLMGMAWDAEVDWFVTQPLTLKYELAPSIWIPYTPDVLTSFVSRNGLPARRPLLCEIKYREELNTGWRRLRRKFRAAKAYCDSHGWDWSVLDEHAIRGPKLNNIRFLWSYQRAPMYEREVAPILGALARLKTACLAEVSDQLGASALRRSEIIWTWWCLVARKRIQFDITQGIRQDTVFWLSDVEACHECRR